MIELPHTPPLPHPMRADKIAFNVCPSCEGHGFRESCVCRTCHGQGTVFNIDLRRLLPVAALLTPVVLGAILLLLAATPS